MTVSDASDVRVIETMTVRKFADTEAKSRGDAEAVMVLIGTSLLDGTDVGVDLREANRGEPGFVELDAEAKNAEACAEDDAHGTH